MPPAYDLQQSVFLSPTHPDHPSAASTIINIPFSHTSPYSVQITSTKDIVEVMVSDIVPHDPTAILPDTTNPVLLHPWIQDNSKATLLIPSSMTKPKQGFLLHQPDGEWAFHPGRTQKSKSTRNNPTKLIPLPNFLADAASLCANKCLVQGWQNFSTFNRNLEARKTQDFIARRVTYMKSTDPAALTDADIQFSIDSTEPDEIIAHCRRVSATTLQSPTEPKLHEHHKLSPNDKAIWDQSYLEEYLGLHEDTQT